MSLMTSEVDNSMSECDLAGFPFKSYSAFFPLFLAYGLTSEVGAIYVY